MWYLSRGGAVEGPFSEEQLRGMQARGELAGTQLCVVGGSEWKPAETVLSAAPPTQAGWHAPAGQAQVPHNGTAVMQAPPGQPGSYGQPVAAPYGGQPNQPGSYGQPA